MYVRFRCKHSPLRTLLQIPERPLIITFGAVDKFVGADRFRNTHPAAVMTRVCFLSVIPLRLQT